MKITWKKHKLIFKKAAGTSRSILLHNVVWFIFIEDKGSRGIGECNPLVGLSIDDRPDFDEILTYYAKKFESEKSIDLNELNAFPSIKFGFETALKDLSMGGKRILFESDFTKGESQIPINGLLWMASKEDMLQQLEQKITQGFTCIKMKIGAINFDEELEVLQEIRTSFPADKMEIRVDANGAFKIDEALNKLEKLAKFNIHSIEQPIAVAQWQEMKMLVKSSPVKIALDEELIPLREKKDRAKMLEAIKPHYIILKPSLLGGFSDCDEWIAIASEFGIDWWITSALESNIGLNAISQYAFTKQSLIPQGLGTGSLYKNNIDSPLIIKDGALHYDIHAKWGRI
jgi:o-succinylbenzoate synthase